MADTKLEKMAQNVLARPEFIPTSTEGTEHMSQEDIQIPRLSIAQQMSPEVEEGHTKLIEGLKVGEIFNSLTQNIYGKGPLDFTVVRATKPRWVEFDPESRGVVDPDVPDDDPRTEFWVDDTGKRRPPVATKFYDYVLVLDPLETQEIVAMSLKSTGIAVAKALNGLLKIRNAPIYTATYKISSRIKKSPKGNFYQFSIQPGPWIRDEAVLSNLKELYDSLKVQTVKIHDSNMQEVDDNFEFGANTEGGSGEM